MLRFLLVTGLSLFSLFHLPTSAPIPPTEVAPFALIATDIEAKLKKLKELLADAEKFDDQQELIVRAGSVMACLSQAAVEHGDYKTAKFAGPALRDAGLKFQDVSSHEEALAALQQAEQAWLGKSEGEHEAEHDWTELISMYDIMEEMNDRNGGISRSLRRSRGRIEEQTNASTNAILALAMLVDHNYLVEDEDQEQWDQLSKDYQQAMTSLIKAIGDKNQDQIAEFYKAGNRACDQCHEKFRSK